MTVFNLSDKDLRLYLVTDMRWSSETKTLEYQVETALKNGVTMIQFREKSLRGDALFQAAKNIRATAKRFNVPFVINDHIDLAVAIDADGVHLGQGDCSLPEARRRVGINKLIGISVHSTAEAQRAEKEGADYIGAGAVFVTGTKNDVTPLSLLTLQQICSTVKLPTVAIGGIHHQSVTMLIGTGISGIAVISAVLGASDIALAARVMREHSERVCGDHKISVE